MEVGDISGGICSMQSSFSNDTKASLRPFYDERGSMRIVVDMELKNKIRAALIKAILGFEIIIK